MFEQMKNDVELVLEEVYNDSEYYYENWIFRIIHSKGPKSEEIKNIFTKWHSSFTEIAEQCKLNIDVIKVVDKAIYKTSVLKLAALLTDSKTNKDIFDFLCSVYGCSDKHELAVEVVSNKMQNKMFKEQHRKLKKEMIGNENGILVLDNLGIIEQMLIQPERYRNFPFYNQLLSLTTGKWDLTNIVSELVLEEDFHEVRDYIDLDRMGHIEKFKVLDGKVRADVWMDTDDDMSDIMSNEDKDPYNKYILRPIYLVDGLGTVTNPNLVKLDRLKRISGFDLCEKPKKL